MDKDSITAWVAVLGALGAIIKFFYDRHQEAASLRVAFLVEVDRLLWVIHRHKAWFGTGKADPLIPFTTDVYDQQITNVGKLPKGLAEKLVRFYGFVKFLNRIQAARTEYRSLDVADEQEGFNEFYSKQLKSVDEQFMTTFDDEFQRYGITKTA